jgi:3-oxoacyl-[acyl-carrier-protein] synthase-3
MIRTKILGIGSYVPERVVTNEEIPLMNDRHEVCEERQTDTSDEWIFQRTGIRERRYVPNDGSVATSDLALKASQAALADAGVDAREVDCIILGTLSPDIHFPGTAVFLQQKLGLVEAGNLCACYDIRQQCSAFIYGLEMADAFIRTGRYRRILLVGAELHSHSLDYSTRGRDVMVLFGDGAGAVLLGPTETDDPREGVLFTRCQADGTGARDLYLEVFQISHLPYVWYDPNDREQNLVMYPQMNGKKVFVNAVRRMAEVSAAALAKTGLTWDDISWFVPHQANLRINQKVAEVAKIPPEKVLNTIEWYGNTTAASVPLTIDHFRQEGRVKSGDIVLATVFGSGFTWGSAIFRL